MQTTSVLAQPSFDNIALSVWWAANLPVGTPADWVPPMPTTGTVDDQDVREDERDDENEAPMGAPTDVTEAPEEFEEQGARDPLHPEPTFL
jgi:hypothetical protein